MSLDAMRQALGALCDFDYDRRQSAITALRAAIEEAEKQEPVAWMTHTESMMPLFHMSRKSALNWQTQPTPLYTAPPRQWQGLTKREFLEAVDGLEDLEDCWVAIEAKLKEKNT